VYIVILQQQVDLTGGNIYKDVLGKEIAFKKSSGKQAFEGQRGLQPIVILAAGKNRVSG